MNEEYKANYYAMIPAYIRYNNNLKFAERLMYGEITALSNKEGYCFASNRYFANLYGVSQSTISRWISHLAELNSIKVEVIRNEKKEVVETDQNSYRYIKVDGKDYRYRTNLKTILFFTDSSI